MRESVSSANTAVPTLERKIRRHFDGQNMWMGRQNPES